MTETKINSTSFSTSTSFLNFTEFWKNKSSDSNMSVIEVPKTTSYSLIDKWSSTELSKSSSTESSTFSSSTFTNISSLATINSSIKPTFEIYQMNTTNKEDEQFLTKDESVTVSESSIIPKCYGILCPNSTVSPIRNDNNASIINFFINMIIKNINIFQIIFSVIVRIIKIVKLIQI